jgi:hypothetical protein
MTLDRAPAKGASGGLKRRGSGRAQSELKLQRSASRARYQAAHQACAITDGEHTPVERLNLFIAMQNLHTDCYPLVYRTCAGRCGSTDVATSR